MKFKEFYLKEDEEKAIIKDGRLYVNVDALTNKELKSIDGKLNAAGYDIRGVEDLKNLIKKNKYVEGASDKFYIVHTGDWEKIIKIVLGMRKKDEKNKDLLKEVLTNIKKSKGKDVTIGSFINSSTGYILPDGKVLNLGGGSYRANDHRIINNYFQHEPNKNMTDLMEYFLSNTGTIRYIPEGPGLEIVTKPTRPQMVQIENVLKKAHDDLAVDFRSDDYSRKAKTYKKGSNPKILSRDIEAYYSSGIIRDTSFFED